MNENLNIAIIGGNSIMNEVAADLLRDEYPESKIRMFTDEKTLLTDPSLVNMDAVITDRSDSLSGWKFLINSILGLNPDCSVIFITDNLQKEIAAEMIREGVFDLLTPSALTRLIAVTGRIIKEKRDREELRLLSMEKAFGDTITNSSRSMLSIINRDYVYEKVNETFCTAFNKTPSTIIGHSLKEIWGEEIFLSRIKPNVDLCFKGNTVRYESSFTTPQYGNRFYEVIFRPVSSNEGKVTHLLAETFDITELRLSQQVVKEMEDEFRKLESNFPIGFLRCDPFGNIIHANSAFLKILGCDDENSLKGLPIGDFYLEKELFRIHLAQINNEKIKSFGRVSLISFSGTEIACRISGFLVTPEQGANYIDFAFEDSSRELMLENRLLQAQKLETIGSLAGGLAHDFNNILATISGYTEMVLEELPKGSDNSEKLMKVLGAVTRARSLTSQMLTFSRQLEQDKIPVSVSEVLKETVEFIKSGKPDNIDITYSFSDNNLKTLADPTQLFRVFLNLMTNAMQAMEDNGGNLTVKCWSVSGKELTDIIQRDIIADEYIAISVEDSGFGMDPSVLKRIFEPYFTTKGVGKGTGLGLSVVHGIISEIEGEIVVTSKKEKGSVFSVYLPVASVIDEISLSPGERKSILFLSDNKHESRIVSMALENKGYRLIYASDQLSLIKAFKGKTLLPDLVVYSDDTLNVSPDDFLNLLRTHSDELPVIIITDFEHNYIKEKFLNSGLVRQVLNKPVSLKEIHDAIQMSLS